MNLPREIRQLNLIHSATNPDACHRGRKAVSPKGLKTAGLSLSVSTLSIPRINLENKPRCLPSGYTNVLISLGIRRKLFFTAELFVACMFSVISVRDNGGFINPGAGGRYFKIPFIQISSVPAVDFQTSIPMSNRLWEYLRRGLNYLETSGRNCPPNFVHPGGKAYGPLGLTPIAVLDVIQNYPSLSRYRPEDVFTEPAIYENFAKSYVDLLLRHYLGIKYWTMSFEEVFEILQKVWFLGPGLYKEGCAVLASREERAKEYILKIAKLK